MKYVSLDIETTCLEPSPANILMLSMVVEDTTLNPLPPVISLPHLTFFIKQEWYTGSDYALGLNGWILDILSGRTPNDTGFPIVPVKDWVELCHKFLKDHFGSDKVNLAGKNVGVFDYQFLPKHLQNKFRSRMIDPGSVFVDWSKNALPGLGEVKKKLNEDGEVTHSAYDDALDVVKCLRHHYL